MASFAATKAFPSHQGFPTDLATWTLSTLSIFETCQVVKPRLLVFRTLKQPAIDLEWGMKKNGKMNMKMAAAYIHETNIFNFQNTWCRNRRGFLYTWSLKALDFIPTFLDTQPLEKEPLRRNIWSTEEICIFFYTGYKSYRTWYLNR